MTSLRFLVIGLLLVGGGLWALSRSAPPTAEPSGSPPVPSSHVAAEPQTPATTAPPRTTTSEARPDPLWEPNADAPIDELAAPTRLRIERMGVDAPVAGYGIDSETGLMDVPDNVTEVGWYRYGPSPGEPGSAVLAAHVDLRGQGPGVFFDLKELRPGDIVRIDYEDGTSTTFEVVGTETYLKEELPLAEIFARAGSPTLTLVTCGGGFSQSRSSYDSNVVVYARPVQLS